MITGQEFLEKLYSAQEEYTETEERLYSTGDETLDELLERAFCEGYEYAQAEFSDDKKEDEDKLEKEDERIIKYNSKWIHDGYISDSKRKDAHEKAKDYLRSHLDKDADARDEKSFKKQKRRLIAAEAALGGLTGGLTGSWAEDENKVKGALIGTGIGAAAGAGLGYGVGKLADKYRSEHKAAKAHNKHNEEDERQADLLDVADEKMTRAEFKKKWYK